MLEKIKEMLEDKIADVFIEMQDELKITDGFVHPVDEYELGKEIEKMASTIQNILETQEEREIGMTFEEAKKRSDYRFVVQDWFIENGFEEIRRGKFNTWTEYKEKEGVHDNGLAFLECGWIDVELNISCDFDGNGKGINKPVASYFCCVKGRYVDEEEDDDEFRSTGWGNAGYLDDFGYEVDVDWNADDWKEQLEKDMFIKLSMFMREFDLKFDEPNWRGIDAEFDVFDRIHRKSKVCEEKGVEELSDGGYISFSELVNEVLSKTEKENKEMENKNENKGNDMLLVDIYRDSSRLYLDKECDEDNCVSVEVPTEILREWFYTRLKRQHYPDITFEDWYKNEYTCDDFESDYKNFCDFAMERGFEIKRPDGINLNEMIYDFRRRFGNITKEMNIKTGQWDVYMDKDDESYRTCINVEICEDWNDFCDNLIKDINNNGEPRVFNMDIRLVYVGKFDNIKEKTIKTVMSRIENSEDYREYIEGHLGEAVDVAKHNGSLFDLDQILHLKDLLGINVSYDLYHYINGKLDDLVPVDLGLEDRVKLYTYVIEYANGKEN